MKENSIVITDDNGKEVEMSILLTFPYENKNYVVVYKDDNKEDIYAFEYDEDGNLFAVDDNDTLTIIDEVVSAYEQEKN